jgi:glycosyltransferase involved in cell wall biosynthesis
MTALRVVHLIKATGVAGAEGHLLTLLPGLRAAGVDARLLLLEQPDKPLDDYVAAFSDRGVPVERCIIRRHADPALWRTLRADLHSLQPDVVHTHLIHADLYGLTAARSLGLRKTVSSRHNDDAFRHRKPVQMLNRGLWRITRAGIAISESIARFSEAVEGAAPGQVRCIHYGLDTAPPPRDRQRVRARLSAELGLPLDAAWVGMACRLVEQKGVRYGLDAFAQVAAVHPQARLLVAGEGPLKAELQARAAQPDLAGRVHFLGWRSDVPDLLAAFDLLLAPSLWEGFGLVMLEAMAQQTAVIASAVSAIPEVVSDGETGLLAPPRDADALAAVLNTLLADPALRRHMGLMGRDRMETHFSAARMVEQTIALYHQL